jgi:carboxylesterase type B
MSGAFSNVLATTDAQLVSKQFCKLVGVDADAEALEQVSLERLLVAQLKLPGAMPFQPCVDGQLIMDHPVNGLQSGMPLLMDKQVIVGTTAQEFNLFKPPLPSILQRQSLAVSASKFTAHLGPSRLASLSDEGQQEIAKKEIQQILKSLRADRNLSSWNEAYSHLCTMLVFQGPAHLAAESLSTVVERVFVYSFDFDIGRFGAAHASELPLLFGTHKKHWLLGELSGAKRDTISADAVSESMMSRFAAFARSGVPDINDPSKPESKLSWPQCLPGSVLATFSFNKECQVIQNAESPALSRIIEYLRRARRPFGVKVKFDFDVVPEARL